MKLDVREVGYEYVNAVMGVFYTICMSGNCSQKTGLCCCDMLIMGELAYLTVGAVPWFRWLVADLSFWRPGFDSRLVHVGFVVVEIVLGWVFH